MSIIPGIEIATVKTIVDKVMAGETYCISAQQLNLFLFELEFLRLECKIECKQIEQVIKLTKWP